MKLLSTNKPGDLGTNSMKLLGTNHRYLSTNIMKLLSISTMFQATTARSTVLGTPIKDLGTNCMKLLSSIPQDLGNAASFGTHHQELRAH
jgi:hypothetical protein